MQERGVEPLHLSVQDPKSCASANSATPARATADYMTGGRECQRRRDSRARHRLRAIRHPICELDARKPCNGGRAIAQPWKPRIFLFDFETTISRFCDTPAS